jgi:two-component system cell cycle response regulator
MDHELIEEILSCSSLPSLPAVAVRVVELTANPDVKLPELAQTIQNDQGLASKVLRTVNSSFYGLTTRCGSINKAIVLLGLGPVKALALSFSLIGSIGEQDDGFDYQGYWRRGLYTGVAAKVIADHLKMETADEAFLAGLMQDIGVVALHRALGFRYAEVLDSTKGDHSQLVKAELSALEVQHPEIGAMLAQRWKFPDQLVMPVRYHERPTAAPQGHHELVRLVGLGNLAHNAMTDEDPAPALRKLYERGDQWFGIKSGAMQALVKKIADGVKDMSRNLHLDTGASVDAEAIVRKAEQAMIEMASNPGGGAGQTLENLLVDADQYDPLTGAVGRVGFDKALRNGFELSRKNNEALTLVQIGVDGLRNTAMKIGASAGDETINSCIMLMRKHFAPLGGVVCTLGGDIYAMVIYGANAKVAQSAAEEFRFSFEKAVVTWPLGGGTLKVSMGVASNDPGLGSTFGSVQELVVSAVTALKTARAGDGRGIVVAAPTKAAA